MSRAFPFPPLPALAGLLLLLWGPEKLHAGESGWETSEGEPIAGQLLRFEFAEKQAVFSDEDGKVVSVPTSELSADSRWRLLVSPAFARSFPSEEWVPEQTRFLLFAVGVPVAFLLLSFWICALVLLKKANPLKALAGWFGSALLGGFLMGFYLVLSGRSPGSALGILIMGSLVSLVLLSLYVSAIYQVSTMDGLKLLVIHVFGAFFILALALLAARQLTHTFDLEPLVRERVMIPVGILLEN